MPLCCDQLHVSCLSERLLDDEECALEFLPEDKEAFQLASHRLRIDPVFQRKAVKIHPQLLENTSLTNDKTTVLETVIRCAK